MALNEFFELLLIQRKIPRSGWLYKGVSLNSVETVAEHLSSVSTIALLLADLLVERGYRLNVEKVLRMALLHDFHETISFDISKQYLERLGKKGRRIKSTIETSAIRDVFKSIPSQALSQRYEQLVKQEYMLGKSLEARAVHASDCLDLLLKVVDYERTGYSEKTFRAMWNSTVERVEKLKVPITDEILVEIKNLRRAAPRRRRPHPKSQEPSPRSNPYSPFRDES